MSLATNLLKLCDARYSVVIESKSDYYNEHLIKTNDTDLIESIVKEKLKDINHKYYKLVVIDRFKNIVHDCKNGFKFN